MNRAFARSIGHSSARRIGVRRSLLAPTHPMKLQFKHQAYQADAVRAVVDCFQGQARPAFHLQLAAAPPTGELPRNGNTLDCGESDSTSPLWRAS
jgi:hypothetical protein